MIPIFLIIIALFLLVVSIIDFRTKSIPSIFLTAFLFAVAVLYPSNLWIGICGFIMAVLLYEGGFFGGVADIKVMTIIAFMISSIKDLTILIVLVLLYGLVWKSIWNVMLRSRRKKLPKEFPFLPVFLFVYIAMYLNGALI